MNGTISILGCGWLGFPLATSLHKKGWRVKGSTTTPQKMEALSRAGIEPYCIDITKLSDGDRDFFKADTLLVNIPPTRLLRQPRAYLPLLEVIKQEGPANLILISSTSVYPLLNREVVEDDTNQMSDDAHPLLAIERMFQKLPSRCTVVRFGGLVGGARYPGRFFTADRAVSGARQAVNLIHLDDCLLIIESILQQDCYGEVFNGVADTHPAKADFYARAAQLKGREIPHFIHDSEGFKIISNAKVKQQLGIQLYHPDLMAMLENEALW
ncbi:MULTISPECIES: hypothetical protein [unclassified Carboxylicivirga]|uniref:hypothetical protein n=1 Tax=Carboxylicivirga TaxID=1628153 RepID=UPI003D32B92D